MQYLRALAKAVVQELQLPATISADAASAAYADLDGYDGTALIVLHSTAGVDADETLDAKVQECDTSDGTYTDITGATFTQIDDTAGGSIQVLAIDASAAKQFIKLYFDVEGTTPAFVVGASLLALPKYE